MSNLMQVISHHQYLCSTCGSVLKETTEYIEIRSLRGECPTCGSILAESLIRRTLRPEAKISLPPKIQTADTLLQLNKLRFDIPAIDSFIDLTAKDMCSISGYGENVLVTRLWVRSVLRGRYGGLNSTYVMVADAGNRTDYYVVVILV